MRGPACALVALLLLSGCSNGSAAVPAPIRQLAGIPSTPAPIHPTGSPEYRALWVDAFHDGIKSPKQVEALIAAAHRGNLNALFVQVRKAGDAYFRHGVEPLADDAAPLDQGGYDPLAYLIQRAHAANPPLEVHAWLNTFYVGRSSEVFREHGTEWGNRTYDGTGGGFLDPGVPAARAYTEEVFMQVARNYRIDGIHMDFVRYPDGGDWGYSAAALAAYARTSGSAEKPKPDDPAFEQWRRDQVTAFVHDLHAKLLGLRRPVKLSGALIAYGPGPVTDSDWRHSRTYVEVYQDWETWFRQGYIDLGLTMNYDRDSSPKQQGWFRTWTNWEKDHQGRARLLVGVGAFLNYPEDTLAQIRAALLPGPGGNRPAGIAIYSYASTSLYGTDDFYLAPEDQGYLPRQPYAPDPSPTALAERAKEFNAWFYIALSAPSTYQDPAVGKVDTLPVFVRPAPVP
ncbi:MAG: hypothetical protein NVS9B1_09670 [Candidatus Dormibacteraceae bacterium]